MNCAEARDALSALLDDALTSNEARAAEEHAASCASCHASRAELAEVRQLLRGIDDADESPGLAAAVGRDVIAAIHGRPLGAKSAAPPLPAGGARSIAWTAAGLAAVALAAAAGWAAWEESRRGEKRPEIASPAMEKPAPPANPPRRALTHYGHLEIRATNASTRDAARDLFKKWPGTFKSSEPDANGTLALVVDFEGPANAAAGEFEQSLRDFQREHGSAIRDWMYSSETR